MIKSIHTVMENRTSLKDASYTGVGYENILHETLAKLNTAGLSGNFQTHADAWAELVSRHPKLHFHKAEQTNCLQFQKTAQVPF